MRTLTARFCVYAATLVASRSLLAQDTPPVPTQDEVVKLSIYEVNTSKDVGYQSPDAAQATRMNTPIQDIPMNVEVYNQKFIEDLLATSSDAVLAYEASAVKTSENDAFLARGMSNVGTNFLDGFAQTTGGGGSQPTANIERIEVIKGPDAVLYGSAGGYGAIFNRITKQPLENPFSSGRVILSRHSGYRIEGDNGGPIPGLAGNPLLYRMNFAIERSTTYNGMPREEYDFAPSLAWKIGSNTKIVVEYFYNQFNRHGNWEFPVVAGNYHGIYDASGTFHSYGDRNWNYTLPSDLRRTIRQVPSLDLRHAFGDHIQFRSQLQSEFNNQLNRETTPDNTAITILKDAVLMPRYWRVIPTRYDNYRERSEFIVEYPTWFLKHRLLLGHAWAEQYATTRTDRSVNNYGGLPQGSAALTGNGQNTNSGVAYDVQPNETLAQLIADPTSAGFNPNLILPINVFDPGNSPAVPPIGQRATLYPSADTKTFTGANDFYFSDLVSLISDRVFVLGGMRTSHTENRSINFLSGSFPFTTVLSSARTISQTADSNTGSVGGVVHLNAAHTLTLYANYNQSFTPVYNIQPDGSFLKPETATQKEAGLKFNVADGRISGLVDVYDINQHNVVVADPINLGYYDQLTGLYSAGAELSLNTRITDEWSMFGGYAYIHSHQARGTEAYLAAQPTSRATLFNTYAPRTTWLKHFSFSLGTIYTGARPATAVAASARYAHWVAPAYWQLDSIVNYRIRVANSKLQYNVGLKVSNLLNNTMIAWSLTDGRYSTDPGRTVSIVLGAKY